MKLLSVRMDDKPADLIERAKPHGRVKGDRLIIARETWNELSRANIRPRGGVLRDYARAGRRAAHGAKSVAKTSLGIDRLPDDQVQARLDVCRTCEHAVWRKDGTDVHTCGPMVQSLKREGKGTCGCVLGKKSLDRKEDCPFGYWPTVEGRGDAGQDERSTSP